ncbi:hypothetical protein P148_SR1C00001G0073 [candidate division SR1 bacterium RAAC1_SR1_1]|nr:hypothetical protein P148_SR1C00001G0073 [candidate division SR1 bacterium RAAC1_SR1_1]
MKKQIFGSITVLIGLLASGVIFAQDLEYTDCTQNAEGNFICQEYQSCNNPDGFCSCTKNSLRIPHNTTCLANNTLIKNRVVSSFAVSGSIVTFKFTIQNNLIPKYFELRLPPAYNNPRIRILELTSDGLSNGGLIALQNGFINPKYFINVSETKNIIVTGEIVSSSLLFDRIETSACLRTFGSSTCINEPVTYILPTANYSITQNIIDPKPIFSQQQALYEILVTNNGSKESTDAVKLTSALGNFLGEPILTYQEDKLTTSQVSKGIYSWDLGSLAPGASKAYKLAAPLLSTPPAGSVITTTGSIQAGRELIFSDNIAVTSYTLPTVIDIILENLQKISSEPEANGEELGYSMTYTNKGNARAENVSLTALISGTNQIATVFSLPDLEPETINTVVVTGLVNQNYPIGTRFCFSGTIGASNETSTGNNNSLSGLCYTFVKSADVAIEANLTNELVTINKGTTLTYNIKLSNKGEKTANNITLNLYPSANQSSQTTTILSGIMLAGGEEKTISYTSILNDYPMQGTSISLSGEVSFTGIDLDLTNNKFAITNDLPGLADVYINHIMLPFSGFKMGDTVTYIITYGNSGFASAWNPMVNFALPSSIEATQTEWNLGKSISAGSTGMLVVTGTLRQFLSAGTEFSSQARISTPSAQVTTGNDISLITGTVAAYDNIAFTISAFNRTKPLLNSPLQAVSGDLIQFTISYVNNGNVPANTTITVRNPGALTFETYNQNLSIGVNQQGSITLTGRIAYRNFTPLSPTIEIAYNNTGISRTFTIDEPYVCGDGELTRNEECELDGQGVTNLDQDCEKIQNVCTLVTKRITNRACVVINGVTGDCSDAVITLKDPSCVDLHITPENSSSTRVIARCLGQYTNTFTPVTIDCGNGDSGTGFADPFGFFSTTCSYDNTNEAERSRISCTVGNDNTNEACKRSVLSCELGLESNVVIFDADEEEGTVKVECSIDNEDSEATLEIDCGNGDGDSKNGDHMTYTCKYDEDDFDEHEMNISCSINGIECDDDDVILDEGFVGICGNGEREGYEQCDGGETRGEGNGCKRGCTLDEPAGSCLSIGNANISVQNNEIMPFWWRIYDTSNIISSSKCDEDNENKIKKSTMKCGFSLQQPGEDSEEIFNNIDCSDTQLDKDLLFKNFYPEYWRNAFGNYYINFDTLASSRIFDENILGEHKIRLDKVTYEYCACDENGCDWEETELQNACETNFTITKPYLVQKSAFGITPKATTIDLKNFKEMLKGDPLVNKTDLASVMVLSESEYAGFGVINPMIENFVYRMEKLAVSTTKYPENLERDGITSAKKVPNKDIYILYGKGNGTTITIENSTNITKPFTLIIKDANLEIKGDISVNGMFIVQNGTISFNESSNSTCTKPQTVKGIFVASNFSADSIINKDLNKKWCDAGGLHVKGVLIGGGIENLVNNKRSTLSKWFYVSGGENSIKTQRRNMIFNGASVLIEYSPELRQQLPPGADEFTKALEVYKK